MGWNNIKFLIYFWWLILSIYALKKLKEFHLFWLASLSIHIKNKLVSIFMVTYLPTILINIINQLTNHINGDSKYDLIITVNITSMMVLASIYLSVSASLPSTAVMKPVEVWLLFNLAYPFLVIFVNIILQVSHFMIIILIINRIF